MEFINSRTNQYIVYCNSLHDKKNRDNDKVFIFEGIKLFQEAINKEVEIISVLFTEDNIDIVNNLVANNNIRKIAVSQSVMDKISSEKSPSGIFCIAKTIDKFHKFATIYNNTIKGRKMIIESLRDPGNLGTIIRTAAAMGIDELILSKDCADIYSEKTVRSSMGAVFSQNITISDDLPNVISKLKESGYDVYAAALTHNACSLLDIELKSSTVFVIGNEGHGLSEEVIMSCSRSVIIPMSNKTESLNASIAASILMWELSKTN